jgi:hypothetical protein
MSWPNNNGENQEDQILINQILNYKIKINQG